MVLRGSFDRRPGAAGLADTYVGRYASYDLSTRRTVAPLFPYSGGDSRFCLAMDTLEKHFRLAMSSGADIAVIDYYEQLHLDV